MRIQKDSEVYFLKFFREIRCQLIESFMVSNFTQFRRNYEVFENSIVYKFISELFPNLTVPKKLRSFSEFNSV